jgi:protein-tyrosine-phosphatase
VSAQALEELGVDITGNTPTSITAAMVQGVDLVVTLGGEAKAGEVEGARFENWDSAEPATGESTASNACASSATTSWPGSRSWLNSYPIRSVSPAYGIVGFSWVTYGSTMRQLG